MMLISNWFTGLFRRRSPSPAAGIGGEAESAADQDEPDSWVVVLTLYGDPVTERIAISRLANEGIASRVRRESAGPILGLGVGLLARIDILVPESLEGKAIDVLDSAVVSEDFSANDEDDPLNEIDL
jgi:hypothetical protein